MTEVHVAYIYFFDCLLSNNVYSYIKTKMNITVNNVINNSAKNNLLEIIVQVINIIHNNSNLHKH